VLDAATAEFLEGGCALIVGAVAPDGEPHASRGWGLTVLSDDPLVCRLLLPADDAPGLAHLAADAPIAITAADVPTLRSLQLKGRSLRVEPADDEDAERADRYVTAFFGDIITVDRLPADRLERLRPPGYAACVVVIDEVYDQTPGPGAGARWAGVGA
jgi:hypothetical protein